MPVPDFEAYKVAAQEQSSSTKFNNFVQAVEDEFGAIDNDNVASGANIAVAKLAAGSTWQALQTVAGVSTWQTLQQPSARVYKAASQSIPHNTNTVLTFDSERWDNDAIHDTVTNPTRLTCKTAGKYQIHGHVVLDANATGRRLIWILLNGVTVIARQLGVTSGSFAVEVSVATIYDLAVNDYVELAVFQDSGGALNAQAQPNYSPEFGMTRIG